MEKEDPTLDQLNRPEGTGDASPETLEAEAETSSFTVQNNPPDFPQEADSDLSHSNLLRDCESESERCPADQRLERETLLMSLKRDEEEKPSGLERPRGQEGSPTGERMGTSSPCLGGALQEQEETAEEIESKNADVSSNIDTQGERNEALMLGESSSQSNIPRCGIVNPEEELPICSQSSPQPYVLSLDQTTQEGEKPFKCTICDKSYACQSYFKIHLRTHTGENVQCSSCSKSFSCISSYNRHQKIHTGEKSFLCAVCGKTFRQKSHLIIHERIHTGEKRFKCLLCGATFRQKAHLTKHEKTHREKPHLCDVCGKTFSESSSLRRHLTTVHRRETI